MKNILITGADGFIGSNLFKKLFLKKNYFIVLIDIKDPDKLINININKNSKNFRYIKCNIIKDDIFMLLNEYKFDYIYHLASIVGVSKIINPFAVTDIIIGGTRKIMDLAIKNKSKLLIASTSEIFGKNPSVPWYEDSDRVYGSSKEQRWSYAISKSLTEHMSNYLNKEKILNCVVVRYFNVYGPNQSLNFVVPKNIVSGIKKGILTINESGNQTRSFTYIDDAVEGTIKAIESEKSFGQIFNLSYPKETSIFELINIIEKNIGKKTKIIYKKTPGEKYHFDLIPRRTPDVSKAKELLNWEAKTNILKGIKKTIIWYNQNIEKF